MTGINQQFDIGQQIRMRCEFRVDDVLTDPTTATLTVFDPSENTDNYSLSGATITKLSDGIFYVDIDLDEAGVWYFKWTSTGAVKAAKQGQFEVAAANF